MGEEMKKNKSIKGEDISNITLYKINEAYIKMQPTKNVRVAITKINKFLMVFSHHLTRKDILKIIKVIDKIVESKGVRK